MIKLLHSRGVFTPKALFSNPAYHFSCRYASSSSINPKMESEFYTFGPYKINQKEVFYSTALSYALVNLKPVVPGHILLSTISRLMDSMWPFYVHGLGLFIFLPKYRACLDMWNPRQRKGENNIIQWNPWFPNMAIDMIKREVKRFVDLTVEETSDLWLMAQNVGSRIEHHYNASSLTFSIQDGPQAGQTVPHVHIHILPRKSGDFENNDEIYNAVNLKEKELKEKLDLDKERKERSFEEMAQEADELRKLFT